jgi:hypothetical protein
VSDPTQWKRRPIRRFLWTFLPPKRVTLCRHREVASVCPVCCSEKAAERLIRKLKEQQ